MTSLVESCEVNFIISVSYGQIEDRFTVFLADSPGFLTCWMQSGVTGKDADDRLIASSYCQGVGPVEKCRFSVMIRGFYIPYHVKKIFFSARRNDTGVLFMMMKFFRKELDKLRNYFKNIDYSSHIISQTFHKASALSRAIALRETVKRDVKNGS